MPVIEAHLIEGYDAEARGRLAEALTDAVLRIIPAPPEAVTVMIREVATENYRRGGHARVPAPAHIDPREIVERFLASMEARDLDAARAHLSDEFVMRFPGAPPMRTLEQLLDWSRARYRSIKKTFDSWQVAQNGGTTLVFCEGTLRGAWPDGERFEGIRFIDRFDVRGGQIVAQAVWNDLGEAHRAKQQWA